MYKRNIYLPEEVKQDRGEQWKAQLLCSTFPMLVNDKLVCTLLLGFRYHVKYF